MINHAATTLPQSEAAASPVAGFNGRAYSAPELTRYGSLQALTTSGSVPSMENPGTRKEYNMG